jgi:hypothetical protein
MNNITASTLGHRSDRRCQKTLGKALARHLTAILVPDVFISLLRSADRMRMPTASATTSSAPN